jgi:hypothetical protein
VSEKRSAGTCLQDKDCFTIINEIACNKEMALVLSVDGTTSAGDGGNKQHVGLGAHASSVTTMLHFLVYGKIAFILAGFTCLARRLSPAAGRVPCSMMPTSAKSNSINSLFSPSNRTG